MDHEGVSSVIKGYIEFVKTNWIGNDYYHPDGKDKFLLILLHLFVLFAVAFTIFLTIITNGIVALILLALFSVVIGIKKYFDWISSLEVKQK
jgi:hypothetical protein